MAIKVRCQRCRRKISIDEAFAGGNCRCPYCKAITMVSGRSAVSRATRPDRPDTPTAAVSQAPPTEAVPLAKPVRVQGIITLVLSVFVLLLLVVGVFLVVKWSTGTDKPPVSNAGPGPVKNGTDGTETPGDNDGRPSIPEPTNPFTVKGPNVAGMIITSPVVYVLDGSLMKQDLYEPATSVVRYSIIAMGFRGKFNVVVLNAEGFKPLGDKWITGDEAGDAKAKQFMIDCKSEGATDLAGSLRRAMKAKPKTIVVLTCKAAGGVDELVEQAKRAGVSIFAVMLDSPPNAVKVMKKLAAGTSGQCRQFAGDDLVELISKAEALP